MATTLPIANNNPFALIQVTPDNWQGLTGKLSNGFLTFDTAVNGARAGWINLYNTYLGKGINTPNTIIPKYAPDGGGVNGAYAKFIAGRLNITPDTAITTPKQIWELGKAITFFEAGRDWLPDAQLLEGYKQAQQKVKLPDLTRLSPITPGKDTDSEKKKKLIYLTIATLAAISGLLLWKKNKP
jgi:hypothetical protein